MEKIVAVVAWPIVVLIVILVAVFLFRAQLAALISRVKKVGTGGLEAYEAQPAPPSEEKKGVEEFFKSFDNPLLLEAEQIVQQDLKSRKIEAPVDRERALVRALASVNIALHFEKLYGTIWASQHACLRYLNPREGGADTLELLPIYNAASLAYPAWYQDYPFDRWLGFLKQVNLVTEANTRFFITVAGREFLKYLVATAKPGPHHG